MPIAFSYQNLFHKTFLQRWFCPTEKKNEMEILNVINHHDINVHCKPNHLFALHSVQMSNTLRVMLDFRRLSLQPPEQTNAETRVNLFRKCSKHRYAYNAKGDKAHSHRQCTSSALCGWVRWGNWVIEWPMHQTRKHIILWDYYSRLTNWSEKENVCVNKKRTISLHSLTHQHTHTHTHAGRMQPNGTKRKNNNIISTEKNKQTLIINVLPPKLLHSKKEKEQTTGKKTCTHETRTSPHANVWCRYCV